MRENNRNKKPSETDKKKNKAKKRTDDKKENKYES